jgi:hypothetical protein
VDDEIGTVTGGGRHADMAETPCACPRMSLAHCGWREDIRSCCLPGTTVACITE